MIGAVLYALAPYHFAIDLLERQAIGELSAYIWIPLILLSVVRLSKGEQAVAGLAVSYALLIMSHLPAALLFSMCLLPCLLIIKYYTSRQYLLSRTFLGIVIGIMLSAVYLLPAVLSQDYISSYKWWGPYLHYDRWFFLDGSASPNPELMSRLFKVLIASSLAFIPAWVIAYRYHSTRHRPLLAALLFLIAAVWFMMLPGSRFVWELVPVLKKVQFPWRIFLIADFAVAATVVLALQCLRGATARYLALVPAAAAGLFLAASAYISAGELSKQWEVLDDAYNQARIKYRIDIGRGPAEYIPSTAHLSRNTLLEALQSVDRVTVDPAAGEVRIAGWQARNIHLKVNLASGTDILVKQFYYPGWQAMLRQHNTRLPLEAAGEAGLIQIKAPPGRYDINLQLEPLWQEVAGTLVSALGLLALIVLLASHIAAHRAC
ncbi:MAG: hypothetical protein PVJ15_09270 [Gammaproteobacteria bacterium]